MKNQNKRRLHEPEPVSPAFFEPVDKSKFNDDWMFGEHIQKFSKNPLWI